ncbi:septum site-determining protein MinC [Agarivorans sp. MS3-6]|uniref:septum site-determining protein MinC n=1 Tax=Agarivorans sp. TSD2052 TaxID=2937286 RepID=UPI00200FF732|nr:septum site-determining protein MinC [Agarivorans sp. TSD2052]UPW16863.1 septum site-determining protein MinC [Agarivorans sp. TSD2052]
MSGQEIEFKGTNFTLSVVYLGNNDLKSLNDKLMEKVAQAPQFFNCAPIVVNVSEVDSDFDFDQLKEVVEAQDFVLVGVTGCKTTEQKTAARSAGLAVMTSGSQQAKAKPIEPSTEKAPTPAPVQPEAVPTKVVRGQIRSGQQIYAQNSDLIIIGSVGNGAEVIADGNVHIYGALRGRAVAGASGRKDSKIFCQNLQAELISIAGVYMLHEQIGSHADLPQCIHVEDQQIVFSNLS